MKIDLEEYNPGWKNQFEEIKTELVETIGFLHPHIEHIGSTSINGLSAKPIIDILIGLESPYLLDDSISPLLHRNYVYYPIFNETMPYRRFFVKHKEKGNHLNIISDEKDIPQSTEEHQLRLVHLHILTYNSEHWIRHIAFRNHLQENLNVMKEYQKLKENLSTKEWIDGNDYNKAKDAFIKAEEKIAIDWYNKKTNR